MSDTLYSIGSGVGMSEPHRGTGVCVVGAFPPPVHGMSLVTMRMYEELRDCDAEVWPIDLSPGSLSRSMWSRFRRLPKVFSGLVSMVRLGIGRRIETLYLALSGGYGQMYEVIFLALARLFGLRVFIHHNSYSYVRRRRMRTQFLMSLVGPRAHHFVVCTDMGKRLQALYPSVRQLSVVSNAGMLSPVSSRRIRTSLRTIGFLGNVSYEKGIAEFLQVITILTGEYSDINGVIAGPFMNPDVERSVLAMVEGQRAIRYVGPRYKADKEKFLDGIDLLVFPSWYEHEAEPLTVCEALRQGVPVICSCRGCLAGMVGADCGLLVRGDADDFVEAATEHIRRWYDRSAEFTALSRGALLRARALEDASQAARENAVKMLVGDMLPAVGRRQ